MGECGLNRKAEQTEEAPAVDVVVVGLPESERGALIHQDLEEVEEVVYEDDSDKFDPDEDQETMFARIKAKFEARLGELADEVRYEVDSEEFDSDDEPEVCLAKIRARYDARTREREALYPGLTYADCSSVDEDSHEDDDDGKDK